MKTKASTLTPRMLSDFCAKRLAPVLPEEVVKRLHQHMGELLVQQEYPPYRGAGLDLTAVAERLSLDLNILKAQKEQITPVFDAIARAVAEGSLRADVPSPRRSSPRGKAGSGSPPRAKIAPRSRKAPGRQRRPVIEFPEPLFTEWDEPDSFGAALRLHASRHGETTYHLFDAVVRPEDGVNRSTLISWGRGTKMPRAAISLEILGRIERRYRLPAGYFLAKAGTPDRAPGDFNLEGVTPAERRRLSKGRSSTVEVIRWQIEGQLKHTRLIGPGHRIDRLRFSLAEVRALARARAGTDLHRLTVVADRLGLTVLAVKQLSASQGGEPLLPLVPKEDCVGRQGAAYVSTASIEKFVASYASLSQVAKLMGVHPKTAAIVLDERVSPVSHPSTAGIRLYHRQDVETFLRRIDAAGGSGIGRPQKAQNREENGLNCAECAEIGSFGEIDASIR